MSTNDRVYTDLSFKFAEASTGRKFLEKVSGHLKTEYGVQPTSRGRKAIQGIFLTASQTIQTMDCDVVLNAVVMQEIVENWSKPIRTLN